MVSYIRIYIGWHLLFVFPYPISGAAWEWNGGLSIECTESFPTATTFLKNVILLEIYLKRSLSLLRRVERFHDDREPN